MFLTSSGIAQQIAEIRSKQAALVSFRNALWAAGAAQVEGSLIPDSIRDRYKALMEAVAARIDELERAIKAQQQLLAAQKREEDAGIADPLTGLPGPKAAVTQIRNHTLPNKEGGDGSQ